MDMVKQRVLPDDEILMHLNNAADTARIRLSYTHKIFFLRLLNIMTDDGTGQYIVKQTINEMATSLQIPARTITDCLAKLTACGALSNISGKKTRRAQIRLINKNIFLPREV